jgi:hypothetical protein
MTQSTKTFTAEARQMGDTARCGLEATEEQEHGVDVASHQSFCYSYTCLLHVSSDMDSARQAFGGLFFRPYTQKMKRERTGALLRIRTHGKVRL